MTRYEELLDESKAAGLTVKECPLQHSDGITVGRKIGIRSDQTSTEKACTLAEEMAHAEYTVGNILDQSCISNQKQEILARVKAYDRLIGIPGLIAAHQHGCRNQYDAAEYLEVTEAFLKEAVECYRKKYGVGVRAGKYLVMFEPALAVIEFFQQ